MNGPTFATAVAPPTPKPAPPRPTAPTRAAAKPEPDGSAGLRVLTYLQIHWLMILFCGSLLGGVGAYAAYELLTSKYESTALIQVDQVPSSVASNSANQARTEFSTYVNTARTLLRSDFVLNSALREIKDLPTIKAQKDPIKFLTEEVQVSAQSGDELIKITFAGHNPADAKKIVDAIQAAFMKEAQLTEANRRSGLVKNISDAKEEMEKRLRAFTKRPETAKGGVLPGAGLAGKDGLPGPVVKEGPDAPPVAIPPNSGAPANAMEHLLRNPSIQQDAYLRVLTRVKQIPDEVLELRRQAQDIQENITKLHTAPPSEAEMSAAEKDLHIQSINGLINQSQRRYNSLLGTGNAQTKAALDEKEVLDALVARLDADKQTKARAIAKINRNPQLRQFDTDLATIRRQLAKLEADEKRLKEELTKTQQVLLELPAPIERGPWGDGRELPEKVYDVARTQLLSQDSVFAGLDRNYWQNILELTAPPRVREVQKGSNPTQKDTKKQIIGTIAAGLLGFAVIALGVVGYETVAKRVSSLGDLKSASPAPVVGIIPCLPGEANGRDPAKRAAANEAIDKLRAYVAQSWLSRGATCVAVTSPLGDEGKAFTSFGLASSLAQAGYKTLLVDFDLRDPIMHTYAGVPNEVGMCEVLRAETDVRRAVVALPNGLDLLPAGRWSDQARQAAVGGRLGSLLGRIKAPYDCVILHAHALLTVAEAVEVARQCEVVLVCALYRETKLPLLRKATDRVATMEVPYSGVVYVGATGSESLC